MKPSSSSRTARNTASPSSSRSKQQHHDGRDGILDPAPGNGTAAAAADTNDATAAVWNNLVSWIQAHGGRVHVGLELRQQPRPCGEGVAGGLRNQLPSPSRRRRGRGRAAVDALPPPPPPSPPSSLSSSSHQHYQNRGVFATQPIGPGEILIQLPRSLAVDGRRMPREYDEPSAYHQQTHPNSIHHTGVSSANSSPKQPLKRRRRRASSWLRCLAAYYYQQSQASSSSSRLAGDGIYPSCASISKQAYFDSLPQQFETVALSWTSEEVDSFLAGTTSIIHGGGGSSSSSWTAAKAAKATTIESTTESTSQSQLASITQNQKFWQEDQTLWKERYWHQIRPYLEACQVLPRRQCPPLSKMSTTTSTKIGCSPKKEDDNGKDDDYDQAATAAADREMENFLVATQCLSTRCFHVAATAKTTSTSPPTITTTIPTDATTTTTTTFQDQGEVDDVEEEEEYTGPYLLPAIDLLNHCSSTSSSLPASSSSGGNSGRGDDYRYPSKCTTLQATCEYFVLQAERPIAMGEEICHSYGDDLTAGQCLQTFGFVERSTMEILARWRPPPPQPLAVGQSTTLFTRPEPESRPQDKTAKNNNQNRYATAYPTDDVRNPTPALLSKQLVLESCWDVIESGLPQRLGQAMTEAEMDDDIWTVSVDKSRNVDHLPDYMVISRRGGGSSMRNGDDDGTLPALPPAITAARKEAPQQEHQHEEEQSSSQGGGWVSLSDSLVTLACLPFLPTLACQEVGQTQLRGKEILRDYFLGNLVCTSLLNAIKTRSAMYKPIVWNGVTRHDDQELLRELLSSWSLSTTTATTLPQVAKRGDDDTTNDERRQQRAMYGLSLRLDEKMSLEALRNEIVQWLDELDSSSTMLHDDDDEDHDNETNHHRETTTTTRDNGHHEDDDENDNHNDCSISPKRLKLG